eukprot:TRINITY_DN9072_c2_g1_i1.p1 TRINITY_DN9072_c2_g1~~TRINITY_DN9072_c2_g1_i1.p1  ORF type:complete len:434 (+),score=113.39 TRINITY_DN9072_c2_g1_i1:75-1376(+)
MGSSAVSGSITRDVLFYLSVQTLAYLMHASEDMQRNDIIAYTALGCNDTISALQAMPSDDVAAAALCQSLLLRGRVRTSKELSASSVEDQRNTLIVQNHNRLGAPVEQYQALSTYENSRLAYHWMLNETIRPFLGNMSRVTDAAPAVFGASATLPSGASVGLDCMSVEFSRQSNTHLGVFHSLAGDDVFNLYLAESKDLVTWSVVCLLSERASMGKFYLGTGAGGVLLLYEANADGRGPSVAAAWYKSEAAFRAGAQPDRFFLSDRTLSSAAEGTPNLLGVRTSGGGGDGGGLVLEIGLHYYKDGTVDQQALATLTDWRDWIASPVVVANQWIAEDGFAGKVGGRSKFFWHGQWLALEAQQVLDDWSSWRVLVGDGLGFVPAPISTPHSSQSFANPFVRYDAQSHKYLATLFVPSEGSGSGEAGELVYEFFAS